MCVAWVEFQCVRCKELHRLAFQIVAYTRFYQHQPCPEGWQPKEKDACIHDYAERVAKFGKEKRHGKPYRKKRRFRKPLKSTIYADDKTPIPRIVTVLKQYIEEFYSPDPETLKIEVDFR